jgi:predicted component of type VI protein secretion system
MIVRFMIVEPESKKGAYAVRLPLLVGRSREAKFRIQQERVSRRHCEFTVDDGIVYVRDLGSTNGTHLEGTPVPNDRPLRVPPGALVRVGSIGFLVDYDHLAETPTVELRAHDLASADTLGPAGEARSDIDIHFEVEHGSESTPAPAVASDHRGPPPGADNLPRGATPVDDTEGDVDGDLRRFLEGLG